MQRTLLPRYPRRLIARRLRSSIRSHSFGQSRAYVQLSSYHAFKSSELLGKQHTRSEINWQSGHKFVQGYASSATKMAAGLQSRQPLHEVLTPQVLESVRNLWFKHLSNEDLFIVPGVEDNMRWFMKSEEFDSMCMANFHHVLETVRTSNATAADILAAVNPSSPFDWLALVLLFDQISRNCYRGPESAVVFKVFDPLALGITQRAIEVGIPARNTLFRYRLAYRSWFYLPLMHSEDPAVHEVAVKQYEALQNDIRSLIQLDAKDMSNADQDIRKCQKVLVERQEEAEKFCSMSMDFEVRHQVIIARFGRYPHRNEALGRSPTVEEKMYLEDGGETFA